MSSVVLSFALLAAAPTASAADGGLSVGVFGGALFTPQLDVLGDTLVVSPRIGYWVNDTVALELDASITPIGETQEGANGTFGYFSVLPAVNLVGRVFQDQPVNLILNFGVGPFIKSVDDDGALGLPGGSPDIDFGGISGPGIMVPIGPIALRTEYRWILSIGADSYDNRGASFIYGQWTAGLQYLPTGPRDSDKDGIADEDDACPEKPEDLDEYQDIDGCPDPDNDGDNVADIHETCDNEPEDLDGFEDSDGCPDPDNDGDEILDGADRCPNEPGTQATGGCPDADEDGVADAQDECPAAAGFAEAFGCPDEDDDHVPDYRDDCPDVAAPDGIDARRSDGCSRKAYITSDRIVITEPVSFSTGRAVLRRSASAVLDDVVSVLERVDGITQLQVEGHTDSRGEDDANMELSQRRAEAVVEYLVSKGVSAERLIAKGFGEEKAVADNETAEGRAANERIEFNIVEQSEPEMRRQKQIERTIKREGADEGDSGEGDSGEGDAE